MQMDAFLWMFLPVFVAGGSALLSFCIMQAKMEVALAKERESLAEARATMGLSQVARLFGCSERTVILACREDLRERNRDRARRRYHERKEECRA